MSDSVDFVCINLQSRPDRKITSEAVFDKLGILELMNWWTVDKNPDGGIYGCFESHWGVWNNPEFTKDYLCVFEDDLEVPSRETADRFWDTLRYIKKHDVIMMNMESGMGFGKNVGFVKDREVRLGYYVHLGCYVLCRKYLHDVCKHTKHQYGLDVDVALMSVLRMHSIHPPLFKQLDSGSDNGGGYRTLLPLFSGKCYLHFPPVLGEPVMEFIHTSGTILNNFFPKSSILQDRRV